MHHRVFVYGTLLRGDVNHRLLNAAEFLGACHTRPCFTMYALGAYPGVARGGETAIAGEVYRVTDGQLRQLDRLEDYPRLFRRIAIPSPFGRAWIYLFRGSRRDRTRIPSGNWREPANGDNPIRSAAIRQTRDPKNPRWQQRQH